MIEMPTMEVYTCHVCKRSGVFDDPCAWCAALFDLGRHDWGKLPHYDHRRCGNCKERATVAYCAAPDVQAFLCETCWAMHQIGEW